jgi:manganese/iron transport system permease protein
MDSFFYLILIAGAVAGGSTGLLGVYIIGMRMPFIGTCISHAAMAGAIYGSLLHLDPTCSAMVVSVLTAGILGCIRPETLKLETNTGQAIVFSTLLGLTFLGIGLIQDSRNEALSLLWGNLLFVRNKTIIIMAILSFALIVFVSVFNKELKATLFSRSIAAATGVPVGRIVFLFLILTGIIVAVNLKAIGGLLIFSLITNPAAAAYQLGRGFRAVVILSVLLGLLSAAGGFLFSYYANLPTGACIALMSSVFFAGAIFFRIFFRKMSGG